MCDHVFGKEVGLTTAIVRVTCKWFKKCSVCKSRKAISAMVRCIGCRVLVHERCVSWKSYDDEATRKVLLHLAMDCVDAATNTETATAVDAATNTESATSVDAVTNTETATAVDAATNTESATSVDAATSTETVTAVDAATSTETATAVEVATNTEVVTAVDAATSTETATAVDAATSTETATTAVAATNTETATAVDAATSTETATTAVAATNTEMVSTTVTATNTETVPSVAASTNTESAVAEEMEPVATRSSVDVSANTEEVETIESVVTSTHHAVTTAVVAGDTATSQDDGPCTSTMSNHAADGTQAQFKSEPICALQELCMARNWPLPNYEFFEDDNPKSFLYSAVCTVFTWTVRVEGMHKKHAKRQAATLMYNKIKHFVDAPPTSTEGDGRKMEKVHEVSTLETSEETVDHPVSPAIHVTDGLLGHHGPPVNESVIAAIEKCEQSLFSMANGDLGTRLRLSKNPSVLELKQIDVISVLTVPSNVDLVQRIVEEEGLTSNFKVHTTCTLSTGEDFAAVQLTISPRGFIVVGFGKSVYEGQENAAFECLTRFKSMLKD